ncbi:ATP-dependent helicase [Bradyrhizobium sp. SHOUNA76]|uniref:ATP-dependent helicase n=1 Tax=Bradyrhizobium sp. SHOUNA76 TaxID=2908927 RepID=UPI001FF6F6F3|nr:ATP-dependent helicase [Bradyrhizobium sp. SHOUNA76]MCJ9700331.1 UvrD-helicase domain-containing protein [Bradyrhizobium sp. SHOUNA76]
MDAWIDIRRKARECHAKALKETNGDRRADKIIAAALKLDDLEVEGHDFEPGLLGALDRAFRLVKVKKGLDEAEKLVVIAHEIGHFHLHRDPHNEVTARRHGLGGDPVDSGAGKVEGYSPHERKEVQADIFAGEFVCPGDWLREEFVKENRRPKAIARKLGVPVSLVMNQMVRAVLLPPVGPAPEVAPAVVHDLDASQQAAVVWNGGPLLVEAGPGTGKTRTLVRRVQHKLEKEASPASFLALTFSRKASEEMRERIAGMNPDAAIEMWVGTFHQFGLELVTKWPLRFGRTSNVRTLDQTGQLELLEANLEKLPLKHFQNLYEPAYELVPVLRVISRCKDELISPDQYEAAAEAFKRTARTEEEHEDADRALEVAAIYRIYQDELKKADAVDFGDLVAMAAELVKEHPEVQAYVAGFRHILVDEFQDVNFASAELLRALTKSGVDVWVVADPRQSIYRFRGAEPSNVSTFEGAFGGKRQALANNYRSLAPIVNAFARFSGSMGGGGMRGAWTATRGGSGAVTVTSAPTLSAEGEAIRSRIEELRNAGIPYADQAILARSHLSLGRVTGILEQLGVPLLYLGDLFERAEVRDLLSLVSIDAERGGIGLVRVASLPDYGVARTDALAVIAWSRENKESIFESLKRADEIEGLSEESRNGLKLLGSELDGLQNASPWVLLTAWLFERSNYLHRLLGGQPAIAQQQLIAIYQLLKVCGEYAATNETNRKRFLDRIRRIEALNEDTAYRAISSEASEIDAVRVMTIHGSKGLEFRAVHLPVVATGYMPSPRRGARIEPPPTLQRLAVQPSGHEAEEECLFFVALSRARDALSLTRAERYTASRGAKPSKFLDSLNGFVSTRTFAGSGRSYAAERERTPVEAKDAYAERELEIYTQCPARYRNEFVDGLRGGRDESAYIRFHRCVYMTVGWLETQRESGNAVTVAGALQHLAEVWAEEGPVGHAFEKFHRSNGEGMVRKMAETIAMEKVTYARGEWSILVGKRHVLITPDRVLINADGSVRIQRIRTGKKTKSEADKRIYALLRKGAAQEFRGRRVSVEAFYLATGEVMPVPAKNDDKLLAEYADAIAGIERGEFHAVPEARRCPNCSSYFICTGA